MMSGRKVEFWSSVEYGTFLRGLERELSGVGWEATQRYGVTESEYRNARSMFARARMRARTYVSYPRQLRRRVRVEAAPDALVVCTNTFYAPSVALRAGRKRGIPIVHWVFDLFPDVLVLSGKLREGSFACRQLRRVVRATFDRAAANVFLGERLRAHAEQAFGPIARSVVIPVGADAARFREHAPALRQRGAPLRVLHCGNLGRTHDTDTIATMLHLGAPKGCTMAIRGNGAGFIALASCVEKSDRVSFGPNLPDVEWTRAMLAADVALVTMRPGAERLIMPSKTYSAMAAGQAILAVCPRASDLADTVLQHDAGWVVEPGDVASMRNVLEHAIANPQSTLVKRSNAFCAAHTHYDQRVIAGQWQELLAQVGEHSVMATVDTPMPATNPIA